MTPLRIAGILALGSLEVLLGALTRGDDDPLRATTEVALAYGFGIVLPLATAWLATSSIGDLVEDRLLVYLWLKPVPRWQLPAAAVLATVTIVVPLVGIPLLVTAVVAGTTELLGVARARVRARRLRLRGPLRRGRALAAAGALVEPPLHPRLGERPRAGRRRRRAALDRELRPVARGATRRTSRISYADRGTAASIVVPLVVGLVGLALAVIRYRRTEID